RSAFRYRRRLDPGRRGERTRRDGPGGLTPGKVSGGALARAAKEQYRALRMESPGADRYPFVLRFKFKSRKVAGWPKYLLEWVRVFRRSSFWWAPRAISPGASSSRGCFISPAWDSSPAAASSASLWRTSTRRVSAILRAAP